MACVPLTEKESRALSRLLARVRQSGFPVPQIVFEGMCETFITCPIELAILRSTEDGPEVLLIRREKDKYFPGDTWHMPGSVVLPGSDGPKTLAKLIDREVGNVSGEPICVGTYDVMKGDQYGQCVRGQEVSRLYALWVTSSDEIKESEDARFFRISEVQDPILLTEHQMLLNEIRTWILNR